MKATKTVKWTTGNGKEVEIIIERTKEVQDNISYADGWNVNIGKKTVDTTNFEIYVDGQRKTRSSSAPYALSSARQDHKDLIAAGAYARLGDTYIAEEQYNMIMATIAEMDTGLTESPEYTEVKVHEEAKEAREVEADKKAAERYAQEIKSGMCPKCGTWCYGDCSA